MNTQKQAIIAAYQTHRNPYQFFKQHTQILDQFLIQQWQTQFSGCDWCLLAMGGYGRGELYPHSDIDLALITPNELSETQQKQIAQFVQTLWDNQLTPALQSGSLKQFIQAANEDLSVNTALLEARFLAGDATFAEHALNTFRLQRDTVSFIDSKIQEMQTRHAKQPALTLEPNIKNGIGSLRDIHTIIWLARVQNLTPQIALRKRIITPTEAKLMRQSHQHLAQLRIDLHLAAGREEDRLIFDHQATLAQHSSTEQLMHRFYRTVKTIMQLNSILIPMLKERVYSTYPRIVHNINEHYFQIGNKIAAHDLRLFQTQPEHIFQIINICQSRSDINGIAPKTLRAWWAASQNIDQSFYQNPHNRAQFISFFHAGHGLTHTLRFLNLYGILARYLPNWHKIVGLLQHDLFHIYPVDDHILMVLSNLRRLAMEQHSHEQPALSTLMHSFPKPHVLYLAALFHDIAKGRNGDHAKLGIADAQQFAQDHSLPENETQLLTWLVSEHLLMSQTAQKEDINDPEVIERFSRKVQTQEQLTALYLLTVADMRGTNPKIWNSWKAQLLETLFQAASAQLSGCQPQNDITARYRQAQETLTQQGYAPKAIRRLSNALGAAYFSRHNPSTIAQQLPQIAADPERPIASIVPTEDSSQNWRITVYMPNRDRLFTRLCRLFSRHRLNIVAARAFVTAHDFILDNFIVTQPENSDPAECQRIQAQLQHELNEFVNGNIPQFAPTPAKPSRRARLLPIAPRVHIHQDDEQLTRYTIDIVAANRPYLLADLTEVFAKHHISLHYAKIATLDERAEDSFLVQSSELSQTTKELAVKQDLLAAIG
ncbi:[protein-PII] uridylyltransferase [Kingella negevensis]|uniref:Bifunctional uridylyltransferase/uridylyl-removing enzyme n=1 Tax=Kingella negevensis TaxID=1522312 RepID=A0A238TGM2_9NEIS|nr:[protein-PII] uridylyltransferase [Kingella negevensis]MDK4696546.1 [protein-PII] uridylyltransferase [Kingella negevensis]SNB82506.1 Bifunctional uridylyltransferase/uridylyl-removing enzyme [Kingella negevensis]